MFVLKNELVKITMGFMVASIPTFMTIMPVSAADFHPNSDLKEHAAAQITVMEDGKTRQILVEPRSTAPIDEGQAVDEESTAPAGQESVQNRFYSGLLNSYDRLLSIYERLLDFLE